MNQRLLLSAFALIVSATVWAEDIEINETNFPDENFRNWVLSQTYGSDGVLTDEEIAGVTEINVWYKSIQSLKGIEFFTALTSLCCSGNQLTTLDVSKNTALDNLSCDGNQLTALDVSQNTALTFLYCSGNQLATLDVSNNTALYSLYCSDNQLTSLDVSQNPALAWLKSAVNQLTSLDVSQNTMLYNLDCGDNQLTSLDVSQNSVLKELHCGANQLTSLDVSKNTKLFWLDCSCNQIRGAAMDALVASLPTTVTSYLNVIWNENEQNVITTTQVAAAKAKGWTTQYYDGEFWREYDGSDPEVGISSPVNHIARIGSAVYDLSGRRVGKIGKGLYIVEGKKGYKAVFVPKQ